MAELTKNQEYHLLLADIAMAMAISTYDPDNLVSYAEGDYAPGALRDAWLAGNTDRLLRQKVTALASAGLASLQTRDAAGLLEKAGGFGVPLPAAVADDIVQHFADKRAAVLTYRR